MKANEAPEKIYLNPLLMEDGESIVRRCTFERQRDSQIEYTRTDVFVEKAATWIANRYQVNGSYLCADDVEDFRKYMEGE